MEQVNTIELSDEKIYPDESVLSRVLGKSYKAYCKLIELFDRNDMTHEWRYYKDGKAWLCKVQKKDRTIVWMSAWKGFIKATIYFPDKYYEEISNLSISEDTRNAIASAKNVGKSKPCMFDIKDESVLKDFEIVMTYKIVAK